MANRFESTRDTHDNGLTFDDTIDSKLRNELYVLMAGSVGAFGEVKRGASQAAEHPGTTAVEIGTAAVIGAGLGYFSQRAGVLGLAARGVAGAMGVSFAFEGLSPWTTAMSRAWDASSTYQLDRAAGELSRSTGKMLFDTLLTAPFAVGGAFAGRGLRSALTETAAAEAPQAAKVAPAARPSETPRASRTTAGERTFHAGFQQRAQRPAPESFTRRPEVLVGEIIDAEPRRATRQEARPRVEIIDAEFTVIEMPEHRLPGATSNLPATRFAPEAPVVIVHEPTMNQFNVVLRNDHPLTLSRALTELRRFEPAWATESGALVSPSRSRMTPEQIARILKNAYTPTETRTGQIIDIRA